MVINYKSLADLVAAVTAYKGTWNASQGLGWDANIFIWEMYEPDFGSKYTRTHDWAVLLEETIAKNSYDSLTKDQVLSILFGLHHRNRIIDGLWVYMLEEGVTQKLLTRLLVLDTDKY